MSKMKEIDDIAQGIADVTKELMYDSIDWQLADQKVTGDDYNELHSYVMQLAIRKMYEETQIVAIEQEWAMKYNKIARRVT